jgi:signal peptidase I
LNEPDLRISEQPILPKKRKPKSRLREWAGAIFYAFVVVLLFRTFFFEAFTIPSSSMEKTLLEGDYILVSKLHYGARLPITPLSIPFFHQHLTQNTASYLDWIHLPYFRFPGFSKIHINDILVFNAPADPQEKDFPVDERTYYIKRCMGRAGDTFELKNSLVYINGVPLPPPPEGESEWVVKTDTMALDFTKLRKLNVYDINSMTARGHYLVEMTRDAADSVRTWKNVLSVTPNLPLPGQKDEELFPYSKAFNWNLDNFGPFRIPKKGMQINLQSDSLALYGKIITDYEHNTLDIRHDSIFINGNYSTTYVFKMNYYFLMGDNRHYSQDSRYWGFTPEDHIVGKAVLILTSIDRQNKGWRWNRLFKAIH